MSETQIRDAMAQMIRVGFVSARQPETMRVTVEFKDTVSSVLVSQWLLVLTPRASVDAEYDLPDIGDQVLCLFLPYGHEQGFVIGAMYGKQAPPVASGEKWHRTFKDGTTLEYDREEHLLSGDVKGDVQLKVQGNVQATVEGTLTMEVQGDVQIKSAANMTLEGAASITLKTPALTMQGAGGGGCEAAMQANLALKGNLTQQGDFAQQGNITSSGAITDAGGNTNHHSH